MRKIFLSIAVLGCMLTLLTACSSGGNIDSSGTGGSVYSSSDVDSGTASTSSGEKAISDIGSDITSPVASAGSAVLSFVSG